MEDNKRIYELLMGLKTSFDELQATVKQEIAELRQDIAEVKKDVAELKRDIAVLKKEVSELKRDVAQLKMDIAELQTITARLSRDSRELQNRTSGVEQVLMENIGKADNVDKRVTKQEKIIAKHSRLLAAGAA